MKVEFSDVFLQVAVENDCRDLLTINTHRGLFRNSRLQFGIKTTPANFQRITDMMLTSILGTVAYHDGAIVPSLTDNELSDILHCVFNRMMEYGLQLGEENVFSHAFDGIPWFHFSLDGC